MKTFTTVLLILVLFSCKMEKPNEQKSIQSPAKKDLKALIVDGENNHGVWPKTSMMMKSYLENTGLFTVDIARTKYSWLGPHFDESIGLEDITTLLSQYALEGYDNANNVKKPKADPDFSPNFSDYDLVVSNMGWKASSWPQKTKDNFEKYMKEGGGLVVIHAANNSWPEWEEFNKMIALGGWGDRTTDPHSFAYYDTDSKLQYDSKEASCGSHGPQMEFVIETRAPQHPIMKGLPNAWLHTKDELYERLCGPAENLTILATAFSDEEKNSPPWNKEVSASGNNEPILMTIDYGKGRIFHSSLGHMDYSMECVGFISTFQRGAEWAASGQVTQAVPTDFPSKDKTSSRKWE